MMNVTNANYVCKRLSFDTNPSLPPPPPAGPREDPLIVEHLLLLPFAILAFLPATVFLHLRYNKLLRYQSSEMWLRCLSFYSNCRLRL